MSSDLHRTLQSLHSELAQTQRVDPELRDLLITVLGDITKLLEQPPAMRDDDEAPLADRLESVAVQFEAKHPALGVAIRQVVDTLGKAGI